jgi:hypothetical protein
MRAVFICILYMALAVPGMAQKKYSISIGSGLGTYAMNDLKELQTANELNFQGLLETVDDFPPYLYYSGEVTRKFGKSFSAGVAYRFESTGYKSSYSDYSGSISFEQVLQVNQIGLVIAYEFLNRNKVLLSAQLRGYYSWTSCDYMSQLILTTAQYSNEQSFSFVSNSIMFNPAFNLAYPVLNKLSLHLTVGYCLDFQGELKLKSNPDITIILPDQSSVSSNWSGFRGGLAVSFSF